MGLSRFLLLTTAAGASALRATPVLRRAPMVMMEEPAAVAQVDEESPVKIGGLSWTGYYEVPEAERKRFKDTLLQGKVVFS